VSKENTHLHFFQKLFPFPLFGSPPYLPTGIYLPFTTNVSNTSIPCVCQTGYASAGKRRNHTEAFSFRFIPFLPSSSITLQCNVCIDLTSMHTISLFSSPPILLVNVATVGRQSKRRRKKGSWTGFFRSTSLRLAFRSFACTLFVHLNRRYVEG
jgi:hypothetical protein